MTQTLDPQYNLMMLSGDNSIARGLDTAFYQMLARFSQYWQRIDILVPTAPDATAGTIHGNVHVHPAPQHRSLQPLFIRRKGQQLLRERRYHLVVSHDFGFFYNGIGAYWLLRGSDVPYVSEIHHVEGYPHAVTLREQLWRAAAMRYLPFAGRHVAAFRTVNQEVPQLLAELGIPAAKIRVLPSLYIDFRIFQPQNTAKHYDVLFVGRLASNKGVRSLLEAIATIRQTYPHIRLAIRGEGPLRSVLEAQIKAHHLQANVTFVPRLPDSEALAKLYNSAKMLVCASTVEGNPRVTVEAMACGVPVISSPVGIMPELITHGQNGLLFPWDVEDLAAQIMRLLSDDALCTRMGEAGRLSVQHFNAEAIIANYARAYHALIEASHTH